jgi:hypothetical protein
MDYSKYIDIIIKLIQGKVKEDSKDKVLDPSYFSNLFPIIEKSIKTVIKAYNYPEVDSVTLVEYFEVAKKQYLSVNPIDIEPSNSLTKKDFETWLTAERKEEMKDSWNYSERYFTMLKNSGRSDKVIEETRDTSLEILEKIGDPKSKDAFYVKGLVVGSVQSGKTGNFNAVINRAIDSGYQLIIVLSGLMEDLRTQTQLRIENDIIGEVKDIETGRTITKGVGKIRRFGNLGDQSVNPVISITSAKSDFKKSLLEADFSLSHTNILVCKNNVSILRNLIVWLHDYLEENKDQHNIPLLILDDEADNASLNNEGKKGREYASKTNGHIRALLALFKRKTYLGYTATPFANVLADRNEAPENNWIVKYKLQGQAVEKELPRVDNLFPDDFIVLLNPPSNYIGAKQIFETITPIENKAECKIPLIEVVDDNIANFPNRIDRRTLVGVERINSKEEWAEKFGEFGNYIDYPNFKDYKEKTRSTNSADDFPKSLPNSIKESVLCFILSIAIRESRKPSMMNSSMYQPHHSMLIHVSRYTKWQNKLLGLIDTYVKEIQSSLELDDPNNPNLIFTEFERVWYRYYLNIIEHISDYLPNGYEDEFLTPTSFEVIKKVYLTGAVKDLEVKAINSVTKDKLLYPTNSSKKVIAIGGNRLSRGFTLEGLTINYFVRSTDYSDALLQMGRWFGYRPGYLDCCKLFITQDSIDKYDLVTRTIEELETEFRKMEEKDKTPENFVIRVKKHPGTLKITRPTILKDTIEVNWSYQDSLEQTTKFSLKKEKIERVWADFKEGVVKPNNFKPKLNKDGNHTGFLTCETDINGIINILSLENNFNADADSIIRFIKLCQNKGKLKNWTIAIKTSGGANSDKGKGILKKEESFLQYDIDMTIRRGPSIEVSNEKYRKKFINDKIFGASGKSANLISGASDLSILLSDEQKISAVKEFRENRKAYYSDKNLTPDQVIEKAEKTTIPERVFREKMNDQEALLVVYALDPYYVFRQEKGEVDPEFKKMVEDDNIDLDIPLIGYAIGFPIIEPDPGGVYLKGDYGIEDEELGDEDSELPEDKNEI